MQFMEAATLQHGPCTNGTEGQSNAFLGESYHSLCVLTYTVPTHSISPPIQARPSKTAKWGFQTASFRASLPLPTNMPKI
jgi:hypothetical protein